MELRELRYFLAVAREENITKAAESLYIAQPSLSRQMQNLEKEIGRPLFLRGARKLTLTETGRLLKKRAEEMLALYEKTEAELSAPPGDVGGDIYIGGGESHALQTVAATACAVQKDYPNIRFRFYSGDGSDVIERLDKGLLDFGVLIDLADRTPYDTKYDRLRLPLVDTWGVLMRRDCPLAQKDRLTPEDLLPIPLICSQQSLRKDSLLYRWFGPFAERLDLRAVYNLLYNASLLVKEGMGCAVGLDRLISTEDGDLTFRPLFPKLETHLYIIWKKYHVFSKPSEIFLNYLKERLKPQSPF